MNRKLLLSESDSKSKSLGLFPKSESSETDQEAERPAL